jgi:hypothetical protein
MLAMGIIAGELVKESHVEGQSATMKAVDGSIVTVGAATSAHTIWNIPSYSVAE